MRTLNHSQNKEYLFLWTDSGKLQNLFAKHSFAAFFLVWCHNHSADRPRIMASEDTSEDFWYNEKRLPELRTDGTWKKKVSAKSDNQSYNEVKVKANVGRPASPKQRFHSMTVSE